MLKLVEITKDYPVAGSVVHALKGISVNFRKSEFVSVLGPSGCGKTTLLNILGGLDRYTEGDLVIGDRSTRDFRSRDWDAYRNHSVGFVFQSYNLIPHLTILQNVELALTISGMSRKKKKALASDALLRVGLGGMLKKKPNQLSGGQMQRVAIARAIVNNPEIILAGYSTRIIELYDGEMVADSNPYDGLPTLLPPVSAAETRSPLEEYIEQAEHADAQNAETPSEAADEPVRGKKGKKVKPAPLPVAEEAPAEEEKAKPAPQPEVAPEPDVAPVADEKKPEQSGPYPEIPAEPAADGAGAGSSYPEIPSDAAALVSPSPAPEIAESRTAPGGRKHRHSIANDQPQALVEALQDPLIHEIVDLFDGKVVDIHR